MTKAILSLGSNIGNRKEYLDKILLEIQYENISITAKSSIYSTEPVGYKEQQDFYNRIIEIETDLNSVDLLTTTQKIENKLGRVREFTYSPRTCDIDIITFGKKIINTKNLIVPHPRYKERFFVLKLIKEAVPDFKDPSSKKDIDALLKECQDTSSVDKIDFNIKKD